MDDGFDSSTGIRYNGRVALGDVSGGPNRTSFVVVSPDPPDSQAKFAAGRGWKFRMVAVDSSEFSSDMGFLVNGTDHWPGVSAFRRAADETITRTGPTFFGPGDDYCAAWPLFDLLAEGDNNWEPNYRYS